MEAEAPRHDCRPYLKQVLPTPNKLLEIHVCQECGSQWVWKNNKWVKLNE